MKLSYSQKVLIVVAPVFAIILILDIVFAFLLLGKINSVNDKVRQLNISSQKREEELNMKGIIASFSLERNQLDQYFVGTGNAETVSFTQYLENIALMAGVSQKKTLSSEPLSELKGSEIVSTVRFKFNVSGKWSNVFTFLQMIETLPKVLVLNNVSLSVNTEATSIKEIKSGSKIWTADLDFSVIKLKI